MVSMKLISPSHLCPVLGYSAARTSPFLGVSVCVCVCMRAVHASYSFTPTCSNLCVSTKREFCVIFLVQKYGLA